MHPVPLLRMAQNQALERRIECARGETNRLVRVGVIHQYERRLEAQHVTSIGLAPARRRHHRGAGGKRQYRETLERSGRMAEKFNVDAVRPMGMLIEGKYEGIKIANPAKVNPLAYQLRLESSMMKFSFA